MSTPCPDLSVLPIREALEFLVPWVTPHVPKKLIHPHEKVSDALLISLALLRFVRKIAYFKTWWQLLTCDLQMTLCSVPQASSRLKRLTGVIEQLACEVEHLDFAVIDSAPIPVCRYKRASRCKFPGAQFGFGTQGKFYGVKLHAWTSLNGKVVNYRIIAGNEHDLPAGLEMNTDWEAYGGPKIIGDKGYTGSTFIVPAKSNTVNPDPRWREEYHAARKIIESTFSSLAGRGIRYGQVKTWMSLRLKVALVILSYNLRFLRLTSTQVNP